MGRTLPRRRHPINHSNAAEEYRPAYPAYAFSRKSAGADAGPVVPAGKHRLCVVMIDPEVVLEQVNINPDNGHYSYFGAGIEL